MSSIAIVTDTDCSLPVDVSARHGIRQVPISVHFGQESFMTGVDIDDAQVFERVDREGKLPTTSAPAPGDFIDRNSVVTLIGKQYLGNSQNRGFSLRGFQSF